MTGVQTCALPISIVKHDIEYAGETVSQKLLRTTTELKRVGASATVISALDEVAWQFNLRGADIPYNPFFKSYAIIYTNYDIRRPKLFLNLAQLNSNLYPTNVNVYNYSTFWAHLNATAMDSTIKKIWVSAGVSQAILGSIPTAKLVQPLLNSPVQRIKARKNAIERKGIRDCQIRDAVARMKHIGWIEQQLNNLFQRMNDIKRLKTNISDSHISIERKLKQINDLSSTINTDEKQERVILAQVRQCK